MSQTLLAQASIGRAVWHYALPAVSAMLVTGLYALIDGIFIGIAVGRDGLAAISLAFPFFTLLIGLGAMIGLGAATRIGLALGQQRPHTARSYLGAALWLLLLAAVLLPVLARPLIPQMLDLAGAEDNLRALGHAYLDWTYLGAGAIVPALAFGFLIRNDGRPLFSTLLMSVGALANIALDYLFVIRFDGQLAGAAIASVLAQGLVALLGLCYFCSPYARLRLDRSTLRLHGRRAVDVLTTGLSSFCMEFYVAFFMLLHNRLFLIYGGPLEIAAFAVIGYIETLYYLFAQGIAFGLQPIISYCQGAGLMARLRAAIGLGLKIVLGVGTLQLALFFLLPELLVAAFVKQDPELLATTVHGLQLHLISLPLEGFILLGATLLLAMGASNRALAVTLTKSALVLPLLPLMALFWGTDGIWLGVPVTNLLVSVLLCLLLWRRLYPHAHALRPVLRAST